MIITIPVLLYQMLFVAILTVAHFGRTALTIATIACLAWTSTHLFFPPLAVLQTVVIVVTTAVLFRRLARTKVSNGSIGSMRNDKRLQSRRPKKG
jgi:hypothetical protein